MRQYFYLLFLLSMPVYGQVAESLESLQLESIHDQVRVVARGDLNGDGRKDYLLLGSDVYGSSLSYTLNSSEEVVYFPRPIAFAAHIGAVVVEDVDRDGDQDVLYVTGGDQYEATIYWSENADGAGLEWKQHERTFEFNERPPMMNPQFGDLDGDGYTDLVYVAPDSIAYALATDDGFTVTRSVMYREDWSFGEWYLADLSGDGATDFVYFPENDKGGRTVTYFTFTGTGPQGATVSNTFGDVDGRLLPPVDYDSDGRVDLVTNNLNGELYVYRVRDGGYDRVTLPIDVDEVVAADLNGDGQNDLLFQDPNGGISLIPVVNGVGGEMQSVGPRTGKFGLPSLWDDGDGGTEVTAASFLPGLGVLPGRLSVSAYMNEDVGMNPIWYPADVTTAGVEPPRPGEWSAFVASSFESYPWVLYRIHPEVAHENGWYTVSPVFRPRESVQSEPYDVYVRNINRADVNRDGYPDYQAEIRNSAMQNYSPLMALSQGRPGAYRRLTYPVGTDTLWGSFDVVLQPHDRFPLSVEFEYFAADRRVRLLHNYDADGYPDYAQELVLPRYTTFSETDITMPDLNHDGKADLVIGAGDSVLLFFPYDPEKRIFGDPVTLEFPDQLTSIYTTGDLNGDDFEDLVVIQDNSRALVYTDLVENMPSLYQEFGERWFVHWGHRAAVMLADFDDDGRDELINVGDEGVFMAGLTAGGEWWERRSGIPLNNVDSLGTYQWEINTVTDIDGDGDMDLLFHDRRMSYLTNLARDSRYTVATYFDMNGNNVREAEEPLLRGFDYAFQDFPSTSYLETADGFTTLYTQGTGETQLTVDAGPLWKIRPGALKVNLGTRAKARLNLFAAVPTSDVHSAELSLTAGRMRCNTEVPVWITLTNTGNRIVPASSIAFSSNPGLELVTPPDSVADGKHYYRTEDLLPGESIVLPLTVQAPGVDVLPLTVKLMADFDHRAGTAVHELEAIEYAEVLCSYDPNDKQVSPRGVKAEGFLRDSPELTYTIRFQNTGNDTAYLVVLRDTIDTELDLESFVLDSYSHPVSVKVEDSTRALAFRFDDIMLVDSMTNPPASQGFVTYKLTPREGLVNNDEITNRASIYFDYNPPIVTNTVLNTMVRVEVSTAVDAPSVPEPGLSIAPNPTSGFGRLHLEGAVWDDYASDRLTARVTAADGRSVREWPVAGRVSTLDLRGLAPGLYLLAVYSDNGLVARTQVAVHR